MPVSISSVGAGALGAIALILSCPASARKGSEGASGCGPAGCMPYPRHRSAGNAGPGALADLVASPFPLAADRGWGSISYRRGRRTPTGSCSCRRRCGRARLHRHAASRTLTSRYLPIARGARSMCSIAERRLSSKSRSICVLREPVRRASSAFDTLGHVPPDKARLWLLSAAGAGPNFAPPSLPMTPEFPPTRKSGRQAPLRSHRQPDASHF